MRNLRRPPYTVIFALLLSALTTGACEYAESRSPESKSAAAIGLDASRLRAVTLDARQAPGDSTLRVLRDLGATHVALISFGFQEAADDPNLRFSPDVRWYSESADGARALAEQARDLGMGIILKPQVWLRGGAWTADIDFDSEAEWEQWEGAYRTYLMYVARLADEIDADLLVVGTELANPVQERSTFWRRLIADIRSVYDGRLTYAANWHDDYADVPFWDALDLIGVQAYFPLASDDDPDASTLREGWANHADDLKTVSERENMPILFTEIGYRSVPYAAKEPWRWPSREETVAPDYQLQADLYSAFFETIWNQPWFAGAIIWKYYPDGRRRGVARDFTPQGKPAEAVIRQWFSRSESD